jgi:NAD(P)-dependent dehydrogenase (short-subunit alcohol dehydrogenase family)
MGRSAIVTGASGEIGRAVAQRPSWQAAQHVASGGRIVAFSSSVVAKSFPSYDVYIASKAGVEGLVHVLAN